MKKVTGIRANSLKMVLHGTGSTVALGLGLMLSGCAAGPDFHAPEAPVKSEGYSYITTPSATKTATTSGTAGAVQTLNTAQDIPAQWWEIFHSSELDQLIRSALAQSPTLATAQAALRGARENYNAQAGTSTYPTVTANLGAGRELASAVSTGIPGGSLFNLYNASVNVSYTLDVFGGNQRGLESSRAAVDYQRFQLEAAYLSLTANLVTTVIREASLRAQLQATQEILQAQTVQMDVVTQQYSIGAIPKASVLAQRTLLAQTRASLPALQKSLEQTRHQLAVYAGRLPGGSGLPEFQLDSLAFPQELPVSIPSALVRQRPDIRANEALLHQASADIGVATAKSFSTFRR